MLRDARESANASIEEIAWRTRIRPEFLRALEDERYEDLGTAPFVKGHLHSYARTLGLDAAGIIEAYEREFAADPSPIRHLDKTVRRAKKPRRPRWLLAAVVTGAVLAGVSAVGLLHGPGERPGISSALPVLPPRNEAPAASRGAQAPVQAAAQPVPAVGELALGVSVDKRCWVEVVADGRTVFSGILAPGDDRSFTASRTLKLTLGNASAVAVTFNNARVPLSATGVWTGVFSRNGLSR